MKTQETIIILQQVQLSKLLLAIYIPPQLNVSGGLFITENNNIKNFHASGQTSANLGWWHQALVKTI